MPENKGTADLGDNVTTLIHPDLLAALRAVPGVTEADIEPDGLGGLGLLKLDLEPGADEAEVATRVGRLLRSQFGLGVDADHVQVVEGALLTPSDADFRDADPRDANRQAVRPGDPAASAALAGSAVIPLSAQRAAARPSISRMHLVSSGLDVTATVTLSSGQQTAVGEARGAASQPGVHRAVAGATLRAVEQLVDYPVRFELDRLEVTPMGVDRTVVVSLTMLSGRGAERFTGAAAVREDVRQAVIRATLDALNRRLEMLLTDL